MQDVALLLEQFQRERLHGVESQHLIFKEPGKVLLLDTRSWFVDAGQAVEAADDFLCCRVGLFADDCCDERIPAVFRRIDTEIMEAILAQYVIADRVERRYRAAWRCLDAVAKFHRGFAAESQHKDSGLRVLLKNGEHTGCQNG